MNELVRKDAISSLRNALDIFKSKERKDLAELRDLSNHTIHNASVFQDYCSVSIAILIYSLSKIIERKKWKVDYSQIIDFLEKVIISLENNQISEFNKNIKNLFRYIANVDSRIKLYIEEVIKQAQIKKGWKLYEYGISAGRASEILGISQWELMNYIGKTKISDDNINITDLNSRIKYARELFS